MLGGLHLGLSHSTARHRTPLLVDAGAEDALQLALLIAKFGPVSAINSRSLAAHSPLFYAVSLRDLPLCEVGAAAVLGCKTYHIARNCTQY